MSKESATVIQPIKQNQIINEVIELKDDDVMSTRSEHTSTNENGEEHQLHLDNIQMNIEELNKYGELQVNQVIHDLARTQEIAPVFSTTNSDMIVGWKMNIPTAAAEALVMWLQQTEFTQFTVHNSNFTPFELTNYQDVDEDLFKGSSTLSQ